MTAPVFFPEKSKSLVKKYLSTKVFKTLEQKKTDSGFTLVKAIRSGLKNHDSSIGIYAGDAQSYKTFSPIFDPIIYEYHGFSKNKKHCSDFASLALPLIDPQKKYIKSTRIRVARNLKGFCFPCHIKLEERSKLEKKIVKALDRMEDELCGEYHSLKNIDEKLVFPKGDRFQEAAGINSDFPQCRGVFCSQDKKLVVWVNEEDHLRIISIDGTSDISSIFNRLCKALKILDSHLDFARDETYGYLTSCPTNIGTSMRAGVHIQLPRLEQNQDLLNRIVKSYDLQVRGTSGEKTKVQNSVFDISNAQRLGISETNIIKNLHMGLRAIIEAEESQ